MATGDLKCKPNCWHDDHKAGVMQQSRQITDRKGTLQILELEVKGPVDEASDFVGMLQRWFCATAGIPYLSIDKKTSLTVMAVDMNPPSSEIGGKSEHRGSSEEGP